MLAAGITIKRPTGDNVCCLAERYARRRNGRLRGKSPISLRPDDLPDDFVPDLDAESISLCQLTSYAFQKWTDLPASFISHVSWVQVPPPPPAFARQISSFATRYQPGFWRANFHPDRILTGSRQNSFWTKTRNTEASKCAKQDPNCPIITYILLANASPPRNRWIVARANDYSSEQQVMAAPASPIFGHPAFRGIE